MVSVLSEAVVEANKDLKFDGTYRQFVWEDADQHDTCTTPGKMNGAACVRDSTALQKKLSAAGWNFTHFAAGWCGGMLLIYVGVFALRVRDEAAGREHERSMMETYQEAWQRLLIERDGFAMQLIGLHNRANQLKQSIRSESALTPGNDCCCYGSSYTPAALESQQPGSTLESLFQQAYRLQPIFKQKLCELATRSGALKHRCVLPPPSTPHCRSPPALPAAKQTLGLRIVYCTP